MQDAAILQVPPRPRQSGDEVTKTIGRTPDNDIQIAQPQVSSRHAFLHRSGGELFLEDRGSANGTYLRGRRLPAQERVHVESGEKVLLGPIPVILRAEGADFGLALEGAGKWAGQPLYEIEASGLVISVPDRDKPGARKTLLDRVSFKALPGDLIALMGPSGAGKTTLLLALNGYVQPTGGQVRINGQDLYTVYDALRGSIGYVPQDDIVHSELTVREAVRFSAQARLPPDYSDQEIGRRVENTLAQLGLEAVAHLQIGKPEKKILSGGQRKRVNIAMELVTDPAILFLDEPTSGLASDDTVALVELLADLAQRNGKTIVATIHQPAKAEYEKFNLAMILGQGGIPIYFGPTPDGYAFFGAYLQRQGKSTQIDNPRDMFGVLNQRERPILDAMRAQNPRVARAAAQQQAAREWNAEYFSQSNPVFRRMSLERGAATAAAIGAEPPKDRARPRGQLRLLLQRYLRVKVRDVGSTTTILLQAPIIGLLLAAVFGGQKDAVPYWCLGAAGEVSRALGGSGLDTGALLQTMRPAPDHAAAVFFLVVAAVWFGTSNAAREIVSERAIYLRERMVNLGLFNYVFSKFILLSLFCVIQCTVLLAIVFGSLGFNGGAGAFLVELGTLIVTAMNSVALGLLLSTLVTSSEAAMALTPLVLIPQVVLGGLMVPMTTNSLLGWPMALTPARWGFQGMIARERMAVADNPAWILDLGSRGATRVASFVKDGQFRCAEAQMASDTLNGAWGFSSYATASVPPLVLTMMMAALLGAILLILKRRDRV